MCGDFEAAFEFRDEDSENFQNSEDWRIAEIPSANGHGTAKSLAKLYGILSNDCSRNGIAIMSKDTLELAIKPHSSGPDSVLFGAGIKFGLGFELAKVIRVLRVRHVALRARHVAFVSNGFSVAADDRRRRRGRIGRPSVIASR